MTLKKLMSMIAQRLVYLLAACIIFVALLVSIVRLLTPVLNHHRQEFEKMATTWLHRTVTINQVSAGWSQYQPQIILEDVTIYDESGKTPALQIQQIQLSLSFLQSVLKRQLILSRIVFAGSSVNISQAQNGELTVQGFPTFNTSSSQPLQAREKFTDVLTVLSQQASLTLRDIQVFYTNFIGKQQFVTLYNLNFTNHGKQHVIAGKAILHQSYPTEIGLHINWVGEQLDLNTIKVKAYIDIAGLSLAQWLQGYIWHQWQVTQGIVNAKIWVNWAEGSYKKIQTTFAMEDVELYSTLDKTNHAIERFSGTIGLRKSGATQILAGDDLLLDLPTHLWPVSNFYFSFSQQNGKIIPEAVNVGYFDLGDVQTFLHSTNLLPPAWQTTLNELNLRGSLENTAIIFFVGIDSSHLSFDTNFNQLGFSAWQHLPGMNNLTGEIKWNGQHGHVALTSEQVSLQYKKIFNHPIYLEQLQATLDVQRDPQGAWSFSTDDLLLKNPDLHLQAALDLILPLQAPPRINLQADFGLERAQMVAHYLPLAIFNKKLQTWLEQAFLAGKVEKGHAELRGALTDFPFDKGTGVFSVTGVARDVALRFAPDWPTLSHVVGKLLFSGRKMLITAEHAETLGITLNNVQASIPYFGDDAPQILTVTSDEIKSDFQHGLAYIHASPLETTLGKMFHTMTMSGPLNLNLSLTVPLKNPDATAVKGVINLQAANLDLSPWGLQVTQLNGLLHFTENGASANHLTAQLFAQPLSLDLATLTNAKGLHVIQASIQQKVAMQALGQWLKLPLTSYAQGETDIAAKINLSLTEPLTIQLTSNLKGITLNLPHPFVKAAPEAVKFSTLITAENNQPLKLQFSYGELLKGALVLQREHAAYQLSAASLNFGKQMPAWPAKSGLYIYGELQELDWEKIKNYQRESSATTSAVPHALKLQEVSVAVHLLKLFNQQIENIQIDVKPGTNAWDLQLTSQALAGNISVPQPWTRNGTLRAQFQRLYLRAANEDGATTTLDVANMPAIDFLAKRITVNQVPIGQLQFTATPAGNGLAISGLRITAPYMQLQASGSWRSTGTQLQGQASSQNVSALLSGFGLDVRNFISSNGQVNFNLGWNGPLFSPALAKLTGTAKFALGKGRIVDIGQQGNAKMDLGRMLSLFSLQSIPRRLSLDFSDVFQSGYSFDAINGTFTFQNGNAYTNDLRFDGPVAGVGINGRIGLQNKDYNLVLNVTPYVTSSIPVAAGLLGGPVVGIAALAVNTVIGAAKVTTYSYAVTGRWNNPSWKSVSVSATGQGKKQQ